MTGEPAAQVPGVGTAANTRGFLLLDPLSKPGENSQGPGPDSHLGLFISVCWWSAYSPFPSMPTKVFCLDLLLRAGAKPWRASNQKQAAVTEQLSPGHNYRARAARVHAPQEKSPRWEARAPQLESLRTAANTQPSQKLTENRLVDTVREREGGTNGASVMGTHTLLYVKQIANGDFAGWLGELKQMLCDNLDRWDRVGGGREV